MSSDKVRLDDLAQDFLDRHRRGEQPEISAYVRRNPEFADQIRELFPTLLLIEGATRDAPAPTPPRQLGEYRILREVGRGGMGIVYEAEQVSLGRHVALKVLPAAAVLDPKLLGRFRREAQAAARLHHGNIVPVFGVGEHEGTHFLAMQFIDGRPLDEVIAELGKLRRTGGASSTIRLPGHEGGARTGDTHYFRSVARIGLQLAGALDYAHGEGVLHRDIKPSNLLLDAGGTVWITDFGLARAEGTDNLTETGDIVGTLPYMAPERFRGWADPRSDVYGLGLTLYELLTLRPAFRDSGYDRLIRKVMAGELPRPRRLDPRIPRDLETVVLRMTEKEPGRRYDTARQVADDLGRFLEGRPVLARRSGSAEHVAKWVRRHPAGAALVGVSVVAVIILLVQATLHGIRLEEQIAAKERALGRTRAMALTRESAAVEQDDPMLALLLACEAASAEMLPEAVTRLHAAILASRERATFPCPDGPVQDVEMSATGRHLLTRSGAKRSAVPDSLRSVAHLLRPPDTVRLWTIAGDCVAVLRDCSQAEFSPSGDRVVAVCGGGARLIDLHGAEVPLEGHRDTVVVAHFSPDGQRVLTGSLDRSARLWDLEGAAIARFEGHAAEVLDACFSRDGSHLLTVEFPVGEMTRAVEHLLGQKPPDQDWLTWAQAAIAAKRPAIEDPAALAATAQQMFEAGQAMSVRVFESSGKELGRIADPIVTAAFFDRLRDRVYTVAARPDFSAAGGTGVEQTIRVWGFDGKPIRQIGHTMRLVTCVRLTPDGKRLVVGGENPRLWEPESGKSVPLGSQIAWDLHVTGDLILTTEFFGGSWDMWSLDGKSVGRLEGIGAVPAPDATRIATATANGSIRIWDRMGKEIAVLPGRRALAFTPSGDHVVTASEGGACLLEIARRELALGKPPGPVQHLEFERSGQRVLVECGGAVQLWDLGSGVSRTLTRGARAARFDEDGIAACTDRGLEWYGADGSPIRQVPIALSLAQGAALAPGAGKVAVWTEDNVEIRNGDGTLAATLPGPRVLVGARYDHEGATLLTEEAGPGAVRLWNHEGRMLVEMPGRDGWFAAAGVFGPGGGPVLTRAFVGPVFEAIRNIRATRGDAGNPATEVLLWSRDGARIATLAGHADFVLDAAFSPSGDRIATASGDHTARIWSLEGREIFRLEGHTGPVCSVVFSADGTEILTASSDGTARLWDTEGRLVGALPSPDGPLVSAMFAPDGKRILTAASDGTLRLWLADASATLELARARRTRGLTPRERERYGSLLAWAR